MIYQPVSAQDAPLKTCVNEIDSLVFYNDFTKAELKIDSLYSWLEKVPEDSYIKDIELRLLLHKAYIYDRQDKRNISLELALDIIDQARKYKLPEKEYQAYLVAALIYENIGDWGMCKNYLDRAYEIHQKNGLDKVYSVYCIRLSSYYRFVREIDSSKHYALKGIDYALVYNNHREYIDGCLLMGGLLTKHDIDQSIKYSLMAAAGFLRKHDYAGAAMLYTNIATTYLYNSKPTDGILYSDTAIMIVKNNFLAYEPYILRIRYQLFDSLGDKDSSYYYYKKHHVAYIAGLERNEHAEIKKITEQYESEKKVAVIKSKNLQIAFSIVVLVLISLATIFLIRKNIKIKMQNKVISRQVEELMRMLEQKQVLLSELQHRVKNNLQHVISILEIQKESVDFNNIDELIRGNQNRIHSMALLHKKLSVTDNVNDVDLKRYVTELAELVKDSYNKSKKTISLNVTCEIETMSIEKTLPIGLIIVELVSNSMKHAFVKQNTGTIHIAITNDADTGEKKLYYADSGIGFDFEATAEKGLGMEIIKGLIHQLDAIVESSHNNGFKLLLHFK